MKSSAIHIIAVLLLGIVTFGIGIGKRDLWAPDEPRFGQVAREMIQRKDPFVLHVNGEPYSDKPPLHIWMTVLVTLAQGGNGSEVSAFATRLPSVFGGLLGLLATYGIAILLFRSRRIAFLSTVALCTSLMYFWQANRAQLDMLMAGWAIVAVYAYLRADRTDERRRQIAWWAFFWVAAALGTLSKGPPALIVPLGAVGFHLMAQRDRRRMWRTAIVWSATILLLTLIAHFGWISGNPFLILTALAVLGLIGQVVWEWLLPLAREQHGHFLRRLGWFAAGLLIFAAVVGIWFVPYRLNAPKEVSDDTLLSQTVVRYLAGDSHNNPPWFYLENVPHNIMPWTIFFFLAVWTAYRSKRYGMEPRARSFLASWILFTVIFFSLSPGKRDQYLLPCIPAFALFVGWFFDRLLDIPDLRGRAGWRRATWLNATFAALLAVAALASIAIRLTQGDEPSGWLVPILEKYEIGSEDWHIVQSIALWPLALLGIVSAVAIWWEARRRDVASTFAVIALTFTGLGFYLHNMVYPRIDVRKSPRTFSEQIAQCRKDEPVGIYDFFREDYIVYADYFIQVIEKAGSKEDFKNTALWKFVNPERGRVLVIFRQKHYDRLLEEHPEFARCLRVLGKSGVGHRDMIFVDNQGHGGR